MILGNFNQIPIISLDVNPEVDYKAYYLDMQLHLIATHPPSRTWRRQATGGATTTTRSCIAGPCACCATTVLRATRRCSRSATATATPRAPQQLRLHGRAQGGTAEPAEAIQTGSFTGYGKGQPGALGRPSWERATPSVFKQRRASGHAHPDGHRPDPGKVLPSSSSPPTTRDMVARKVAPKKHRLRAILGDGAELIPEKAYVFVDQPNSGKKANDGWARINLHHVRFRATAPSVKITFTDDEAGAGNGDRAQLHHAQTVLRGLEIPGAHGHARCPEHRPSRGSGLQGALIPCSPGPLSMLHRTPRTRPPRLSRAPTPKGSHNTGRCVPVFLHPLPPASSAASTVSPPARSAWPISC